MARPIFSLCVLFLVICCVEFARAGPRPPLAYYDVASTTCAARISVMNYNTRQLPSFWFINDWDQDARLKRLPDTMRRAEYQADILILDELMTKTAYEKVQELKDVYPYITPVVGAHCDGRNLNTLSGPCSKIYPRSGVMALSKIPIIETHGLIYRNKAAGTWDARANKGAIYIKIRVNGLNVHVVGTHIQADEGSVDGGPARIRQMEELRQWISGFHIPSYEPIILAGDINSPLGTLEQHTIFDNHFVFNFQPPEFGTFSASTNWLARADALNDKISLYKEQYLDYVATWANHLQPNTPAYMMILKLKASQKWHWSKLEHDWQLKEGTYHHNGYYDDVSDHYPVVANFEFAVHGCNAKRQEDDVDNSFQWAGEGYFLV